MLRVNQIKVHPDAGVEILRKKAASILGIKQSDIEKLSIIKQSIDARKKPEIFYSYTVDVVLVKELRSKEDKLLKRCKENQVSKVTDKPYKFPQCGDLSMKHRPVIIGMGPAGLFCGYMLAKHGYRPILLERGKDVDARTADVQCFWETGKLLENSNVQFGEGGAGTFSDGKLNTLIKDKDGRNREVLRIFVEHGAPEKILYDGKPHIGTDVLTGVVKSMREDIIACGGEVRFETEMIRLCLENEKVTGIELVNPAGEKETLPCETVVLAIGHSARNTFETLYEQQIPMEAKSFAVGFRVEHPQSIINMAMYGREDAGTLGAAPYKVNAKTSVGRGVYSFCMCPGGYVVNASSEEGRLAVNGMSYSDRGSENANSAIIVAVTPEDFGSEHPLAGIAFQRGLEEKAYEAGQGRIPVQRFGEFKHAVEMQNDLQKSEADTITEEHLADGGAKMCNQASCYEPCTKGEYKYTDLTRILPRECNQAFVEGMEVFAHQIKGFDRPDALMLGVESRTSSPVRIHRDEYLQSVIRGLYPCGEGAGYAGGITSAAMDGMRVAEEIAKRFAGF
ncbi:MAG: FAD-dependent monooxygenase [Lachnospiraceae bacterium]|nr:FAD-dependent monooxygenase [Lachnospiraceae bacterium]